MGSEMCIRDSLITNQPFLRDIMKNVSFQKASFSTNFIDEHFKDWAFPEIDPQVLALALLGSKTSQAHVSSTMDSYSPWSNSRGWRQEI